MKVLRGPGVLTGFCNPSTGEAEEEDHKFKNSLTL
jgi:hypothetical protein